VGFLPQSDRPLFDGSSLIFPLYRTYAEVSQASPADSASFLALADAKTTCLPSDRWLVDILGKLARARGSDCDG
jgi:hypothetical protein